MKQKTLQEQYNLIKEGKGNAELFVKAAKSQFPSLIRNAATLNETVGTLKHNHLISENFVGLEPLNQMEPKQKESYEIAFENFLAEQAKAEEKKTTKEVTDLEEKNFDYKDKKNIDNVFGEEFLKGYYAEMKDPKNEGKSIEELKEMVAKNLAKDPLHYVKDGQFGEKGVGYTDELPGLKASKTDKMEPVKLKESTMIKLLDIINENEEAKPKKAKKAKKETTDSKLAEIEKNGKIATLEMQIEALEEIIESKNQRITMVTEDENLSELADKKKVKDMQREVKDLEKRKVKMEKLYEKMCGKSYIKKEIVGEEEESVDHSMNNETQIEY